MFEETIDFFDAPDSYAEQFGRYYFPPYNYHEIYAEDDDLLQQQQDFYSSL